MERDALWEFGRLLAERHATPVVPEPERSLLNYAESSRAGDWSLRSALTRLAQPEPTRSGAVLHLVRRLDASLHPLLRTVAKHPAACDRRLSLTASDGFDDAGLGPILQPVADCRTSDLARVVQQGADPAGPVIAGYESVAALEPKEHTAIPLLAIVVEFDLLADTLTDWSAAGPHNPPLAAIDATLKTVQRRLDDLGVPEETRPQRGQRNRA